MVVLRERQRREEPLHPHPNPRGAVAVGPLGAGEPVVGQPVEPPRQDKERDALGYQVDEDEKPERPGQGRRDDEADGEDHEQRGLDDFAARATFSVSGVEGHVGTVHEQPAQGRLPPRRGAREAVRVVYRVVGPAVVFEVNERPCRKRHGRRHEHHRRPAERCVHPTDRAEGAVRGVVEHREHDEDGQGTRRDSQRPRESMLDRRPSREGEDRESRKEEGDRGPRDPRHRPARIWDSSGRDCADAWGSLHGDGHQRLRARQARICHVADQLIDGSHPPARSARARLPGWA